MLELYKNIRDRRIALNMTQAELAQKMGYADKSMIAKIEKGQVDLPQSKIVAFAKALGVLPRDLMGWSDSHMEAAYYNDPAPASLSPDEEELLTGYRRLNEPGQKQLRKQLTMMLHDEDYTHSEKETLNAG